jgi:carboxyl-terminal processing protease
MKRYFFAFIILIGSSLSALPEQLKKTDVRNSLEEMFSYHVEYKELTPLLVKRCFKLFVEQFDAQKLYLLQAEARPFLDLTSSNYESIIDHYYMDEYPEFETLTRVIRRGIERAQAWRQEIIRDLVVNGDNLTAPAAEAYVQYAGTADQLKERLKTQMVRFLLAEKRAEGGGYWNAARREKILSFFDKRYQRFENTYLAPGSRGDHYLAMHILKAMARSLDAHTAYFSPDEAFEMRTALEKQFEGVGVVLKEGVDGVEVADLIRGGPAARSGEIQVGDFLVEVDGRQLANASYDEVLTALKGNGKKEVSLGLKRYEDKGNEKMYQVSLKREKIIMQEDRLSYHAEPFADGIIGKLTLPSFYESSDAPSCEMDIREALKELKRQGKLYGLVLDMRENLGGFLNQAVKVTGLFITSGVVVISKYAQGEVQYLRNIDPRVYYNGPLVILTSKASASAAEIVAQALQDYGVALVVGDERTYGKGSIQYQTVTDNDATAFFKVTVGRYYTVSGRSTQIEGVKTDILVPTEFAPYNIGERYLEYPLNNDHVSSAYVDSLSDIDSNAKLWFQKNYIPYIQKKESVWRKMLPTLKANSAYRLQHDPNYKLFLEQLSPLARPLENEENWGMEDLQMNEAVSIVKDMISQQPPKN